MSLKVDFATFCYTGDSHRLYAPGQLKRQVESNNYDFDKIIIVHQMWKANDYDGLLRSFDIDANDYEFLPYMVYQITDIDEVLKSFNIDLEGQYRSATDSHHTWKVHVVNHLAAIQMSKADYIVFADNDCWMVDQPEGESWVDAGIKLLKNNVDIFIVSPNDGELERYTTRFSQQMFLARVHEFRNADFNQPGWDGNVNIPGGPMPEYWGMLEGRMELYCRQITNQRRYVLGPEYRGWHHNRLNDKGLFETDRSKY